MIKQYLLAATSLVASSIYATCDAQQLIGEYKAYISQNDLFNSSGIRLTKAWEIIRQDRANYHRFGIRDQEDQTDSFFASEDNRAIAERLISRGSIDSTAADRIIGGNVTIRVQIFGRPGIGEYLQVRVEEPSQIIASGQSAIQGSGSFYFVDSTRPPDDWLSLRTDPGPAGMQIAKLYNGTRLQVVFQQPDNWWRVKAIDLGLEGWVLTRSGSRTWVYCCK